MIIETIVRIDTNTSPTDPAYHCPATQTPERTEQNSRSPLLPTHPSLQEEPETETAGWVNCVIA